MTSLRATLPLLLAVLPALAINNDTQLSPGIGPLPASFSAMGGMVIDIVGANGKRLTAQIPPTKLPIGNAGQQFWSVFTQTGFDAFTLQSRLGGGLQKVNIRITLQDGDSGSGNPVYSAVFGANTMPYSGAGIRCDACVSPLGNARSQPAGFDFDAAADLYVAIPISGSYINCGYMGQATTYRLDSSDYHTLTTYTGFPGAFALTAAYFTDVPKLGYSPFAVTGWFTVPANQLTTLYNNLTATGSMTVGIWDADPGDQFYDFTQGIASEVTDVPLIPPAVVSFTATPNAVIGSGTVTFSWQTANATSVAIDNGVVVNPTLVNGSATVTVSTPTTFTLTASGPDGSDTATATVTVLPSLLITTGSLPSALAGTSYSFTLGAAGGTSPYRWNIASGSLPAGLTLSSTGAISGTPTSVGTSTFVVQATDSTTPAQAATAAFTIDTKPGLAITTPSLSGAVTGASYTQLLTASGGTPVYTWSLVSGSLPAGLSLGADGTISGTVTATAAATFTIRATDNTSPTPQTATHTYTIAVGAALSIQTTTLPAGVINVPYSQSLSAAGGTPAYTWTVATGPLPAGLSLAANGTISGTPTAPGLTTFVVRVVDSTSPSAQAATQTLSIYIVDGLIIDTTTLPDGTASSPYAQALVAHNGTPPYVWTKSAGSLPPGLSLLASGGLLGTPAVAGQYRFTITVTDSGLPVPQTASQEYVLNVSRAFTITTLALPGGSTGVPYSASLQAEDGVTPYSYAVVFGNLPPGVALTATGAITGTPTKPGVYNMLVRATDSTNPSPQLSDRPLSITIDSSLSIVTPSLPDGTQGVAYTQTLTALNGLQPYVWTVTGGALPDGLSLLLSGTIVGTPTKAGSYNITVQASDSNTPTAAVSTRTFTLVISTPLTITNETLPNGLTGSPYVAIITTTGAQPPYAYALTEGSLPPGLALSDIGVLFGTPITPGHYVFTLQAQDSAVTPATTTRTFAVDINQPLQISTESLPPGSLDIIYSQQFSATGGIAPYTWLTADALPPGLQLLSPGILIGVPTRAGAYTFTAQVTDASTSPQATSRQFTVTVTPPLLITNTPFPAVLPSVPYSAAAQATGGVPPYSWSLTAGSLPSGLSLTSDGTIAGVTTGSGSYTITLTVTDSAPTPHSDAREFVLLVSTPFAITTTSPMTAAIIGRSYNQKLTLSGGKSPFSCSIAGGSLPPGLSLNADGTVSGQPTSAVTGNFVARCTDSVDESAIKALTIFVQPALGIIGSTIPPIIAKTVYFHLFEASDGTPPFHWSLSGGSLPVGLTLTDGGLLTGTATTPGTYPVTLTVTDSTASGPQTATLSPSLVVIQPLAAISQQFTALTGTAFERTLTATGGTPPYAWSLASGTLPNGLTLSTNGSLSGTPTTPAQLFLVINVADANGLVASALHPLTITGALTIPLSNDAVPPAVKGESYAAALSAYGGTPPYTWTITAGTLPPGLTLSTTGVISGTPTTSGSFPFTGAVTDAGGQSATKQYTLQVQSPPQGLTIPTSSAALPLATVGVVYTAPLIVNGGTAPYTWVPTSGSLPAGLAITGATIVGTPTIPGTYSFSLTVTDAAGLSATSAYVLTVRSSLAITTTGLPTATVGAPVNVACIAVNGTAPYTWTMTPAVPNLQLSTAGMLSGTPSVAGQYTLAVTVTDASTPAPQTASKTLQLTVLPQLSVATDSLPVLSAAISTRLTLQAQGGTPPYLWSTDPGSLPPGLSLATNGVISGTPNSAGTYTFTVHVTDTSTPTPLTATAQYAVVVTNGLAIVTTELPMAETGKPYTFLIQGNGGTAPYAWRLSSGALPPGLTLSPSGSLAGIPLTAGSYKFAVTLADSLNVSATTQFVVVVVDPLTLADTPIPVGRPNLAIKLDLQVRGGTPPYSWSILSGSLPPGLALTPGGSLTGAPTTSGAFTFTVQVTDSAPTPSTALAQLSMLVTDTLAITTMDLPPAKTTVPFSVALQARGGTPPYSWRISFGALPPALSLSADGVLAGVPTTPGTFPVSFSVTDSSNQTTTTQLTLLVADPLSIATATLPPASPGTGLRADLHARGGTPPYSWSLTAGALPQGLSLSTSGALSGAPTTAGTYTFTVQVADSATSPQTATAQFSFVVTDALTILTSELSSGRTGAPYTFALQARGGTPPNTWRLAAGALPPSLTVSPDGVIAGVPSTAGTFPITLAVTDSSSHTATSKFTLLVSDPLVITTAALPPAAPGSGFTFALKASGGALPYEWSLASGTLPPGMTLATTGALSGAPTAAGSYSFSVQVNDSTRQTMVAQFSLTVSDALAILTTEIPQSKTGIPFVSVLQARGGTPPYTWRLTSGALPAGLVLSPGGLITGTPTTAGTFTVSFTATDVRGQTTTAQITVSVANPLLITPTPLPLARAGVAFKCDLQARGGTPPYTWSPAGDLPAGLSLSPAGSITGTPTTPQTAAFAIQVTDAAAQTASAQFSLTVADGLAILTTTVPPATTGVPLSYTLQARGGISPYSWSLASGTLPHGITLSPAGQLTGTPTAAGVYAVSVAVADAHGQTMKTQLAITIADVLSIISTTGPTGTPGTSLSFPLQARGGTQPHTWAIASGSLPPGLSVAATGAITGTPSTPGTYNLTVKVTDSAAPPQIATAQLTFTISDALVITTTTLPPVQTATPYSFNLQARGGSTPYVWSISAGRLPTGILLQANGTITGTTPSAGTYTFAIKITDANNRTATQQLTLTTSDALAITTTQLPVATANSPFAYALQARGGTPPYVWSATGPLPPGITLAANGALSGTPTSAGLYIITFKLNDSSAVPQSATGQLALSIGESLTVLTSSLPTGPSGVAYRATLDARGGAPPYTWRLIAGTLPAGLTLTSSGVIAGTPTTPAAPASVTFEVADSQQHKATVALAIAITPPPTVVVLISPTAAILDPQRQEPLSLTLQTPYPSDITGKVTLSGTTDQDVAFVQAATSTQALTFSIPAGTLTALFPGGSPMLQTGTTAQPFTLTVTTDNPAQVFTQQHRILPRTPEITSTNYTRTATGFTITLAGYSTTAEVQTATFRFFTNATSSAPYTMSVTDIFRTWYATSDARGTGIFRYTQPFSLTGDMAAVTSVEVTLTNTVGTSTPALVTANAEVRQ